MSTAESTDQDHSEEEKEPVLSEQNLETFDPTVLSPLAPEVINRQATINIGTIGHVSHGKSSLVYALSGVKTQKHCAEKIRNITIKLGYANSKIYKCSNPACPPPANYMASGSATEDRPKCIRCSAEMILQRHVSFVDCPGHDILMATMLNGAAVMDAALLLVASNEPCPQPQTCEHLAAIEIMDLNNIIILQNKIDIAFRNDSARRHYEQIKAFINKTKIANAPIIPISAQLKYNIDAVCQYICTHIPIPIRDFTSSPRLIVIRSFDVNRPGEEVKNLKGGVAGGSILRGVFRLGDEVEIRPGIILKNEQGRMKCNPLRSRIVSLYAEKNELKYAVPGGLIGVGLMVDPFITRADNLVGHVLGLPGQLPEVYNEIEIQYYLLKRLVGVRNASLPKMDRIQKLKKEESLMVNVVSTSTGGRVLVVRTVIPTQDQARIQLTKPVCCQIGEKLALSRRIDKHWRLIGWGQIVSGTTIETRDAYMSGILLSSDRSRSRISGLDLDFPEDFSNPIKALELRELQEEENWIRNLKVQRDKVISSQIEELRVVIESKDSRIRDLEDELAKFKTVTSQIAKLQTVLDKTETQAKTKEKELSAQVEQYKKQVKEYQGAFEDMRETMRQEQDQLQRETQKYPLFRARSQSYKEQEELNHLRSEYEKYRSYKSHSDELMETVRRESKERESQLQEQISSARVVEKQLKDQLSEMSYEKAEMETRVKELIMIVSEQENQLSGMKDLEGTFHNTNSQVEQLKVENEKLAYEIAVMKESKDTAKVRAEEDLNLLKEDLNVCTQLVKRQEQTISELRKRKLEDDSEIQSLNGKCQKLQREISSIRDASRGEAEDRQQYAQKIETLMGEMERLRAENADLTKQLNAMIEKEAVERRQKEEYARMRLDLINMRNKEMAAFSDALEGIAAKKFEV